MAQKQLTSLDMNGNAIIGLTTTPSGNNDAVSKSYADTKEPALPSGGTTSQYLRGDKTWQTLPTGGTGDVVGPASATDGSIAVYDGTTGKLLKSPASPIINSSGIVLYSGTSGPPPVSGYDSLRAYNVSAVAINESHTNAGVNIDGVLLKDGGLNGVPIATTTGTQTLTNKTLTAPVINNPTGFLTGAAKITVGTTAPSSPTTGDLWVDTN